MNIGLLGFGVVGSGVSELCRDRQDICVKRVLIRSDRPEVTSIATRRTEDILSDDTIDTVVKVMGGVHPAFEYASASLSAGKNVVTADTWENGTVITAAVNVGEMHAWAQEHLKKDPACFIAGIR